MYCRVFYIKTHQNLYSQIQMYGAFKKNEKEKTEEWETQQSNKMPFKTKNCIYILSFSFLV